jgi:hypothetical protein
MNKLKDEIKDLYMEFCSVAQSSQDWLVGGRFSLCYYSYEYGSGAIDRANFESYDEALSTHDLDYRVTNIEGYTYILINPLCTESIEICNALLDNLESYPILDEEKVSYCDACCQLYNPEHDEFHDDCEQED